MDWLRSCSDTRLSAKKGGLWSDTKGVRRSDDQGAFFFDS